ncbi:hypothetical protein FALBO_21 [Fusarium albosuccineum]|uniref:Rhodopsin domain-containing protein n=1 Tax=Fusarium albosuccineum TaxID=1237068 RepID=A0A8H4LNW1_9HYPO|nr:hypothetical protein FALBO_21 [Fusarium albosuccineum]
MKFHPLFWLFATLLRSSLAQANLMASLPKCAACQAQSCTIKEILTSTNATLVACGVPPGDRTATIIGIPVSFGSLAVLLVIIRVIGRVWVTKVNLDWDDYLIVLAMIFATVLNFVCVPMAYYGMGKDFWAIPFPDINMTLQLLYIAEIFYMIAEMLVQMSLLAFYLRVFPDASLFIRRASWMLMGIVACFGIANTCAIIFQCTPIPFFWSGWAGESTGKCIDINLFSWIRAAVEIAIDVAILSLPLPSVLKLQMSWKKKFQVLLMFALGFVITIVSILRLQSLIQFAKTPNPTFDNSPAVYWSVLECDMFIICACLPALRSVLSKIAPSLFGTTAKGSYPSGGYYRYGGSNEDSKGHSSSHQMSSLDTSGKIAKSVDVDVRQEQRTASDDDLVYPPRSYYLEDP